MNAVCVQIHMLSSISPTRHESIRIQHKAPPKPLSSTMHLWERQTWPRYLLRGVRDPRVLLLTRDILITASFDKMFAETAYIALMLWYMCNQRGTVFHALFGSVSLSLVVATWQGNKNAVQLRTFKYVTLNVQRKMVQCNIHCELLKMEAIRVLCCAKHPLTMVKPL